MPRGTEHEREKQALAPVTPTGDLVEGYLRWLEVERNLSPNTIYQYRRDLLMLNEHARGLKRSLQQLTPSDLSNFIESLKRRRKYQPRTQARKVETIRCFYKWLVREEILDRSPAEKLETPKLPKALPLALTQEEQERIFTHTQSLAYGLRGKRDHCLFHFLFYLGLRVSELAGLKYENIRKNDNGARDIQLFGKGNKERKIPLHERAGKALDDYLAARPETPHNYVFLSLRGKTFRQRISVRSIQHMVKTYRKKLKLPERFTPHKARSTFLSRLVQQGVDISIVGKLAGHANLQTTMGYLSFRDQDIRSAVDRL
jgi:site-specific recombinase XerD